MSRRDGGADAELRRVYQEHVAGVFAFFAYSVTRETAEDLTAVTFERVIRAWSNFDSSRGPERVWILTIARNLLTDHYRRQRRRATVSTDEHPALLEHLSDGAPDQTVVHADLHDWLEQLNDREREILALRYGADLPGTDIAQLTGLTAANIHQILSRSLRRLRKLAEASIG